MGVVYGSVLYDLLLWVPALHAVQNYLLLNGLCRCICVSTISTFISNLLHMIMNYIFSFGANFL